MALVVEDGTIVAGANSFVTRAEIIAYAAARGVVLPDDETTDVLGISVMDYLWTLCFLGDLVEGAEVPFPRSGLIEGDTEEDWEYTIPSGVVKASLQLALDVNNGIVLTPSASASLLLKKSKVGPIEREFFAPTSEASDPPLTVAMAHLNPHLCADAGMHLVSIRG